MPQSAPKLAQTISLSLEKCLTLCAGKRRIFDLTDATEAASCRPAPKKCVGAVSLIRYARKPHLDHLDSLLHERADRPFRLRNSPVRHHLPVSEASETL